MPSPTDNTITDMVAAATGDNACSLVIRGSKTFSDYALLNSDSMSINPIPGKSDIEVMDPAQWSNSEQ